MNVFQNATVTLITRALEAGGLTMAREEAKNRLDDVSPNAIFQVWSRDGWDALPTLGFHSSKVVIGYDLRVQYFSAVGLFVELKYECVETLIGDLFLWSEGETPLEKLKGYTG